MLFLLKLTRNICLPLNHLPVYLLPFFPLKKQRHQAVIASYNRRYHKGKWKVRCYVFPLIPRFPYLYIFSARVLFFVVIRISFIFLYCFLLWKGVQIAGKHWAIIILMIIRSRTKASFPKFCNFWIIVFKNNSCANIDSCAIIELFMFSSGRNDLQIKTKLKDEWMNETLA